MSALRSLRGGRVFVRPSSFRVSVLLVGNHCKQCIICQILADRHVEIGGHGNFGLNMSMCLVVLVHYGREIGSREGLIYALSSGIFPVLGALAL